MLNWERDGFEVTNFTGSNIRNKSFYFKPGITWSATASGPFSCRYCFGHFIFDSKGCMAFSSNTERLYYLMGAMNSKPFSVFMQVVSPTLDYNPGPVSRGAIIFAGDIEKVFLLVKESIALSKEEWDSFETSWDFRIHPCICSTFHISNTYITWKNECEQRFLQLKLNEEELNRIFIDIYGLQDEVTSEVLDKDVTVHRIFDTKEDVPESMKGSNYVLTRRDVIVSLISYAVGCMFGRYSLDVEGLAYAGGDWDSSKYTTYIPDADNILPITDEEYFDDDIVGMFCAWVKKVYGPDTLEENLDFIAKALGNKGNSSREVIRNYFLKDFFKDHCKTYQKRPIYWLFDSGKQNGFKALVYLHRYNADTIGNLRVDYLHRMQRVYESEINRMQDMIDNSTNAREVAASTKRKDKLQKQLKECREYDEKIGHLALSRIELDLDDGVKVNYRKVQTARDEKFYEVLADSKNIMGKQRGK